MPRSSSSSSTQDRVGDSPTDGGQAVPVAGVEDRRLRVSVDSRHDSLKGVDESDNTRKSFEAKPGTPRSRNPSAWKSPSIPPSDASVQKSPEAMIPLARENAMDEATGQRGGGSLRRRLRPRGPWAFSFWTASTIATSALLLFIIVQSSVTRQVDVKGCHMSYMSAAYARLTDFDTEHTRFASKYSLYLYREDGIDEDTMVRI